jgi:hypothetical protein
MISGCLCTFAAYIHNIQSCTLVVIWICSGYCAVLIIMSIISDYSCLIVHSPHIYIMTFCVLFVCKITQIELAFFMSW